ncbi:hypothetical protein J1N35_022402 [Gossypium stocksii]|uniref:Uncharacterized protein n=1 Tax=Gossypium stocksii TaxID=47602 RepID=A0A9D4A144_9ROSI|nr:hypothetical protein J1N35_022402 [Gossypium stocksii]
MLLCQERGIVPHAGEEVLENKRPINEASVDKMTRGKETLKKRTSMNAKTSLWRKLKDVEKIDGIFADQKDIVVEKEVDVAKEEAIIEEEEDFVEKVVTAPESVGTNIENLERTGVRPAKVAQITREEQCNS